MRLKLTVFSILSGALSLGLASAQVTQASGKLVEKRVDTRTCHYRFFVHAEDASLDHPEVGYLFPTRASLLAESADVTSDAPERPISRWTEVSIFKGYIMFSFPFDRRPDADRSVTCDLASLESDAKSGAKGVPRKLVRGNLAQLLIHLKQLRGTNYSRARQSIGDDTTTFISFQTNVWTRVDIRIPQRTSWGGRGGAAAPLLTVTIRPSELRASDGRMISHQELGPFPVDSSRY